MSTKNETESREVQWIPAVSIQYTYDSLYSRDPIAAAVEIKQQTQRCLETAEDPYDLPVLRKLLKRVKRDSDSLLRVAELGQMSAEYILTSEDTDDLPELIWLTDNIDLTINAISRAAAQLRDAAENIKYRIDNIKKVYK